MPKIIVNAFLTLDGVMQAPGAPDEDPEGGDVAPRRVLHDAALVPGSNPRGPLVFVTPTTLGLCAYPSTPRTLCHAVPEGKEDTPRPLTARLRRGRWTQRTMDESSRTLAGVNS